MSAELTEERYGQIIDYLRSSSYPKWFNTNQRRGLRQQAQCFEEKDGILYRSSSAEAKLRRVILSNTEKDRLMKACHNGIDGGHFGRDKTISKVCLL